MKISIVIPTLNAEKVLEPCLSSIRSQNFDQDMIEILLCDGGSTDKTKEIAKKYDAKILFNPLKTGEAGKAVGVKNAKGKYIALIDSDNILPTKEWLNEMINPLETHKDCVGSEPIEYTYRKEDGFITRYSALLGMNDPVVLFLGNYDRKCVLTGKWTEANVIQEDKNEYIIVTLKELPLPTIGANGTIFRTNFLKNNLKGDYLFDIDILVSAVKNLKAVKFIKVKNGIIHTFCESNIKKFALKQRRRIRDYIHFNSSKKRSNEWTDDTKSNGLLKFVIYTVLIVPTTLQSIRGYVKKPDFAWFFHPIACLITLWEYSIGIALSKIKSSELDRSGWKQ